MLGLLTTKPGALEDAAAVEAHIREATRYILLTPEEQAAKLGRVAEMARRV